jgi:hypothetical protein
MKTKQGGFGMGKIRLTGAELEYEVEIGRNAADEAVPYVTVTWGDAAHGYVAIPSEIEGLPVKRIGGLAFSAGCGELTGVTMPDSVVWICESAFAYSPMLTCVKIPPSVRVIGECAFAGCEGLRWVDIPEGVVWMGFSAFIMCYGLVRVTIPSTLESIPMYAFSSCRSLLHVTISHGVKEIKENAFDDCIQLESITIPDSVMRLGRRAFLGCRRLKNVSLPRHLEKESLDSVFVSCSKDLKISYRGAECVHRRERASNSVDGVAG